MIDYEFFEQMETEFAKKGFRQDIPVGVDNILIVRLDVIGDFVITSGFIREVRANFPNARITLVVSPLVYPIAELCPYVNEVLAFDRTQCRDISSTLKIVGDFCKEKLWHRHFTIAFSPQWGSENFQGLMMVYLSGAKTRIGYGYYPYQSWIGKPPKGEISDFDNILLTDAIITPREIVSECEKSFYLLSAAGLTINDLSNEIWYGKEDAVKVTKILSALPDNLKKIAIGIGAGFGSRQYPMPKLAKALNQIANDNLAFVIVGGKSEIDDAEFLMNNVPNATVLNLVGKTTLRETEAIIAQMDYYIGNDSGVMHMAAAVKIPCLVTYRDAQSKEDYMPGIFSESRRFPPWMTKSVVIRPENPLDECAEQAVYGWCRHKDAHCITQILPEEIVEGFAELQRIAALPEE